MYMLLQKIVALVQQTQRLRGILLGLGPTYIFIFLLSGCMSPPEPPRNVDNVCYIFKQYPKWYKSTKKAARRWRVPIAVQMAIIHQESHFQAQAKPARRKLLWVIPWTRPSTAYGYSQALDSTWNVYKNNRGWWFSSRESFADSADFIGWYANQAYIRAGIPRSDAYSIYLAYHEGVGGYQRRTHFGKPWLLKVARKVERRAKMYQWQLEHCKL